MPDFNIFCNNCGNNGHLFYQCKKPITSIGILLFTFDKETIKYLFSTIQSTTCLIYTVLSSGLIYLKFECQFL